MNTNTVALILALLASPFIGIFITSLFNKNKTNAETNNLGIDGEINIGEAWMKYGQQMQKDLLQLRIDFNKLSSDFEEIRKERDALAKEKVVREKRIEELEDRVKQLEDTVKHYETMGKDIKEQAHVAIDKIADNVAGVV